MRKKDPLALKLLAEWNNVAIPNLRLNEAEIEALLGYMEEESRRVEGDGHGHGHHGHH